MHARRHDVGTRGSAARLAGVRGCHACTRAACRHTWVPCLHAWHACTNVACAYMAGVRRVVKDTAGL
eukprot:171240-Chlamydomonas_euryale.AAC.4